MLAMRVSSSMQLFVRLAARMRCQNHRSVDLHHAYLLITSWSYGKLDFVWLHALYTALLFSTCFLLRVCFLANIGCIPVQSSYKCSKVQILSARIMWFFTSKYQFSSCFFLFSFFVVGFIHSAQGFKFFQVMFFFVLDFVHEKTFTIEN